MELTPNTQNRYISKNVMLSHKSQTQSNTYCRTPFLEGQIVINTVGIETITVAASGWVWGEIRNEHEGTF